MSKQSRIVAIQPKGSKVPLFCIHAGAGHALHYGDMAELLGNDQPVYGVSPPELDPSKELATVEQLAALYLGDIREIQSQGPYQICGLSLGGVLAFEMASQLVSAGERVGMVAIFDAGNPVHFRNLPPEKLFAFRITYLADRIKKYAFNVIRGNLGALLKDARRFLVSRLSSYGWKMIRAVSRLLGKPIPTAVRSDFIMFSEINRRYAPRDYSGQLLLFRAEERPVEYSTSIALGWDEVAPAGVMVHYVPGDHVSMMNKPNVIRLVEQLKPHLANSLEDAALGKP